MSREERTGWRDQAYSEWHRALPYDLDFLDIDWIEYCHSCKRILAVYELSADIERLEKEAYRTRDVATGLGVPGYVVLYEVKDGAIVRLRVRRLTPPVSDWKMTTPAVWTKHLLALRKCHPLDPKPVPVVEPVRPTGQNPDGTWGELGWYTEAPHREWG